MNICHDFKPQLSEMLSPQNNPALIISKLVLQRKKVFSGINV